jgi:HSP20 family protein
MSNNIERNHTQMANRVSMRTGISDWNFDSSRNVWTPPTDVFETAQDIVVRVEIAGVSINDFDIDYTDGILSIRGNRSDASERKAFHRMEIRYGNFQVNVKITVPVNATQITAEYKDGLLIIRLPKAETKRIQISI